MNRNNRFGLAGFAVLIAAVGSLALVQAQPQPPKDTKPATPAVGEPPLPPGWTQEDMEACVKAGTPGSQHEHLTQAVGVWQGKSTMWMAPGTEPMQSECTSTITSIMDGRFTKCEMTGEISGMGTYNGLGIYGYDNVTQKFQSSWIGNCSTDIMTGVGELSSDGKTLTWVYSRSCPITGKPTTLRDIERRIGPDKMTLETWGVDPTSGKEFKTMEVVFTRTAGSAPASGGG